MVETISNLKGSKSKYIIDFYYRESGKNTFTLALYG
jgi:hypothetical protein